MRKIILLIAVVMINGFVCRIALAGGPKKISKCMTITKSGSYVVNKNLQATAKTDGHCIIIDEDNVTLDLNGFTIKGLGDSTGKGVYDDETSYRGIIVRNGVITGFEYGIRLAASKGATIEKITATNNFLFGINPGHGSTVIENIVSGNSGTGIGANDGCTIIDNTAYDNDWSGISAGEGGTIIGNTAYDNGKYGLITGYGSTVTGNTARKNKDGMKFYCPSSVIGNTSTNNTDSNYTYDGSGCNFINNLFP